MKYLIVSLFWIAASFASDGGHEGHKSAMQTVTGEVMDLTCYMAHPENGKGKDHAGCAKKCIQKGMPVGILTSDGKLYVAGDANHKAPNDMLAEHAGKTVTAMGEVKEMNGVKMLLIKKLVSK